MSIFAGEVKQVKRDFGRLFDRTGILFCGLFFAEVNRTGFGYDSRVDVEKF